MTPNEQIQSIAHMLENDFNGCVAWEDVLLIKSSPYNEIARLYGAAISRNNEVQLLDNNGDWYRLKETDRNFEYVAPSVIQRLRFLKLYSDVRD